MLERVDCTFPNGFFNFIKSIGSTLEFWGWRWEGGGVPCFTSKICKITTSWLNNFKSIPYILCRVYQEYPCRISTSIIYCNRHSNPTTTTEYQTQRKVKDINPTD